MGENLDVSFTIVGILKSKNVSKYDIVRYFRIVSQCHPLAGLKLRRSFWRIFWKGPQCEKFFLAHERLLL